MSVKSDRWIKRMALEHGMISPFEDRQVRQGVVSYGVSSYGYDIRVADEFKIFTNINSTLIDPKDFDPKSFVDLKADAGTLRKEFGESIERNATHGSDAAETAAFELGYFFRGLEFSR